MSAFAVVFYLLGWGRRYGLDLAVYRDSAFSLRTGHNPYLFAFTTHNLRFTYPVSSLPTFIPLTWLTFFVAQDFVWAMSIALATCGVALVLWDRGFPLSKNAWTIAFGWSCLSSLLLEPVRSDLDYGQIEIILMFIVLADLLVIPRRFSGIGLGLAAAIKLTPIIFVLVFLVRRDIRSAGRTIATFVVLTVLSWLVWPAPSRTFWLHDVFDLRRIGTIGYNENQSWLGMFHRGPFPLAFAQILWAIVSVATLALGLFIATRCSKRDEQTPAIIVVALTGLLISPVSWTHHWVWVMLIPPMLVGQRGTGIPAPVRVMFWGLVALAALAPYSWIQTGTTGDLLGSALPLWTAALLIIWGSVEAKRPRTTSNRSRAIDKMRPGEPPKSEREDVKGPRP